MTWFDISGNQLCPPYPNCLSEVDIPGLYGQDTSQCPGEECELGDYNGYYDCSQTCLTPIYFDYLGDDSCDDSGISFDCYNYGYDCGDCSEEWDGTDPLGFCNCPLVTGDTNEDGDVNILDIMIVVNFILSDTYDDCSDLNYDGNVDVLDIMIMVNLVLEN